MFANLCLYTGYIVFIYGIGLLAFPNFFMGSFIYRAGVWDKFKQNSNDNIIKHLMLGLGLTWICWATMGYYMMYNSSNLALQTSFAKINAVLWSCWCLVDAYVREFGIYSTPAKIINMALTVSLTLSWTYVGYF